MRFKITSGHDFFYNDPICTELLRFLAQMMRSLRNSCYKPSVASAISGQFIGSHDESEPTQGCRNGVGLLLLPRLPVGFAYFYRVHVVYIADHYRILAHVFAAVGINRGHLS